MESFINDLPDDVKDPNELGAWILPISQDVSVAVGRYELKYIEYISAGVTLPGVPAYCEQGFVWRNRFIPALDIQNLVSRRRVSAPAGEQLAAIVAYENASGEIDLGAILLRGIPKLIGIAPQQSVAVSQLQTEWQLLAQAAFHVNVNAGAEINTEEKTGNSEGIKEQQGIFPVLDLRSLFDKTPADLLALH